MGQSKKKEKKKITLSQSSLRDFKPEREEHLFSTQLISQERNPAAEINHFEVSGLEWLVPKGKPLSLFLVEGRILRGREGNNLLVHACGTNFLFFFSFLSLFFPFFFLYFFSFFLSCYPLFLFLGFQVLNPILFSPSLLSLYIARAPFYSACRDWILLF